MWFVDDGVCTEQQIVVEMFPFENSIQGWLERFLHCIREKVYVGTASVSRDSVYEAHGRRRGALLCTS